MGTVQLEGISGGQVGIPGRMGDWQILTILVRSSILAVLFLVLAGHPALAGTETGEFCPTCPDWTNLDGWMAQKQAYEQQGFDQTVREPPEPAKVSLDAPQEVARYPHTEMVTGEGDSTLGKVLIDARSPEEYSQGHMAGARNLYWKGIQASGRLDSALAERALQKIGINDSDDILLYGSSDDGAAFLFWALSYLGHQNISLLDGGMGAASGMSLESSAPWFDGSDYKGHPVPGLLVNESLLRPMLSRNDIQILDARDFSDYGRSRLTGRAIQIDVDKLIQDGSSLALPEDLEAVFERRGLDKNATQLVYGTPRAYTLFYCLKLMGYQPALIEGDWWSKTKWAVSNVR